MKNKNLKKLTFLKASFLASLCLQIVMTVFLASQPTAALAQTDNTTADVIQFEPQIKIPDSIFNASSVTVSGDLIAQYVQTVYKYGMAIVGILAAIILMAGGILWLTSGGDSSKISQAKELISGSIIGTGILFGSWIILNTVNPDLLKLKNIDAIAIQSAYFDDGSDGQIDDIKNLPADATYGWVCANSYEQHCEDSDPPTINLNASLCQDKQKPESYCPYARCCAKSESTIKAADALCQGKIDYANCTINQTAAGYCLQNKCLSIKTKVCCQCGQGCIAGVCVYVSCQNDMTAGQCLEWCTNGFAGYYAAPFYGGSENYTCTGGVMSYCNPKN